MAWTYVTSADWRITDQEHLLKETAEWYLNDDPRKRENVPCTLSLLFGIKSLGICAQQAKQGNLFPVYLNFIKKFQFPNPKPRNYKETINDGILIAPLREIVKILYHLLLLNEDQAYLTYEEVSNFILYNNAVAKNNGNIDYETLINDIFSYRQGNGFPATIAEESEKSNDWKANPLGRGLRELVKILAFCNFIDIDENIIKFKNFDTYKCCIDDVVNYNDYFLLASTWTEDEAKANWLEYLNNSFSKVSIIENKEYEENKETNINNTEFHKDFQSRYERNIIYFGAPGTGKSFKLNESLDKLLKNVDKVSHFERVTFHPDYSYANFVGTYKPVMKNKYSINLNENQKKVLEILQDKNKISQEKYDILYEKFKDNGDGLTRLPLLLTLYGNDDNFITRKTDGTETSDNNSPAKNHGKAIRQYVNLLNETTDSSEISYEYVPGPFMRVLAKALKSISSKKPEPYLLIIEEINRANVAAVFGDIFQLLDRNDKNCSEYEISTTNDMRAYLASELGVDEKNVETIKIPSNMFIWATMNSADQGVFPMDTAFKRRWDFKYIDINENDEKIKGKTVELGDATHSHTIEWNELRNAINDRLTSIKVNEDKLIGPYFLSNNIYIEEKIDQEKFQKSFKNKLLMYLFEDAAKLKRTEIFNDKNIENLNRYSSICKAFDIHGIDIFHEKIVENVKRIVSQNTNTEV